MNQYGRPNEDDDGFEGGDRHDHIPVMPEESTNLLAHVGQCTRRYNALVRLHYRQSIHIRKMRESFKVQLGKLQENLDNAKKEGRLVRLVMILGIAAANPELYALLKRWLPWLGAL